MKTCPVCALELEDTFLFCPDDGSNLSPPTDLPKNETNEFESDRETVGSVVLYCPTCAAEYPLTFSLCPVHGVPLTRHRIPRPANHDASYIEPAAVDRAQASATETRIVRSRSKSTSQLTRLDLARPQIESRRHTPAVLISTTEPDSQQSAPDISPPAYATSTDNLEEGFSEVEDKDYEIDLMGRSPAVQAVQASGTERPGFRIAAIATVIALVLFAVVALSTLASRRSRKPSSLVTSSTSQTEATPQPAPFVPTPQEARDYKEEQPAPVAMPEPIERPAERPRKEKPAPPAAEVSSIKTPVDRPLPKPPAVKQSPTPVSLTQASSPPPRASSAGFDTRLIRVRGRRSPSGYRYDLTFNLQEQAGRSAYWQRVLISTHSASGSSHSEAIPFVHRLGASGALTFTISVELAGRTEADWRGRVTCTTLGWDNNGGPLQTSFGANVTP